MKNSKEKTERIKKFEYEEAQIEDEMIPLSKSEMSAYERMAQAAHTMEMHKKAVWLIYICLALLVMLHISNLFLINKNMMNGEFTTGLFEPDCLSC